MCVRFYFYYDYLGMNSQYLKIIVIAASHTVKTLFITLFIQ